jgi:hypothetical protein
VDANIISIVATAVSIIGIIVQRVNAAWQDRQSNDPTSHPSPVPEPPMAAPADESHQDPAIEVRRLQSLVDDAKERADCAVQRADKADRASAQARAQLQDAIDEQDRLIGENRELRRRISELRTELNLRRDS